MKTVLHYDTLIYYDGVMLFEARDPIGGHYIASLMDDLDSEDVYAVVGVSPQSLRRFRVGALDLKALMLEMPEGVWYTAKPEGDVDVPIKLHPQTAPISQADVLPDDGLFLYDHPIDGMAVIEARARRNLVFEFSLDPPEAASDCRVRSDTLAETLALVKNLAFCDSSPPDVVAPTELGAAPIPPAAFASDAIPTVALGYGMVPNVEFGYAATPAGAFRMILEASRKPDAFDDETPIVSRLRRVDDLFDRADDYPENAVNRLRQIQNEPLTSAFVDTLGFLARARTGLRYSWATPAFTSPIHRGISQAAAAELYNRLSEPRRA